MNHFKDILRTKSPSYIVVFVENHRYARIYVSIGNIVYKKEIHGSNQFHRGTGMVKVTRWIESNVWSPDFLWPSEKLEWNPTLNTQNSTGGDYEFI